MSNRISQCISCGGTNFKYYAENKTLKVPIHICQNCKLHVAGESQKQLDDILKKFYEKDYWDITRNEGLDDSHSNHYSVGRKRIFLSQIKYVKKFLTKNSKVLEIGSGNGETLIELEKLNFQTTGIEPDLKNVEHLRKILKKSKIIQSNIENLDIDEKFDFIWMSHVFEHLSDPISFLNNIKKNTNKNYFLFIEVPNVTKKNDWRTFTVVPHAYNYSGTALQNILQKTGYKIISCDYFGPPTKLNGGINKISSKIFKKDFYPFYPKMLLNADTGEDIRIIAQHSEIS
jgi:2-polyprenyl-3-methyl-5-hydroxy-6-metoxy-1,4-benzoquinol methylase